MPHRFPAHSSAEGSMKQLTLVVPEDVYDQLAATAEAAGQSREQVAVAALNLGLQFTTAAPAPPPSLSADLDTLQTAGARDQYLDW
jgi:hypothetical protein